MKIRLKLYGTLPAHYPGLYPDSGLIVDISENTTVADLVERVKLPQEHVAIVAINGMLAKAEDVLPEGAEIKFFQPLNGG
ncbi:sulfur carrier protein ThiS [Desulfopila sp. IMCC35006]|uniref:MoaD/ThiS family protein n=1 Tax=Desulfopila sp. IMCC35006 TaxID=2569542 RepID=UPI0010AC760F|nr:MoaD/ThiS family protein [Desulfopila sp. IMCC35006]TKB26809.1 sulfur carrier protein ThiS [Desulfopila sp. IMCC35006]